jgi:type VI secretion system secreted protein VgrG
MDTLTPLDAELESSDFDVTDLQVLALRGREQISQLSWFEVDLVMRNDAELPAAVVPGVSLSLVLRFTRAGVATVRKIHGILEWVRDRRDALLEHSTFTLRIVPELSRLLLTEMQDLFVNQTIPAIIEAKLGLHELDGQRLTMSATGYTARELVMQYRESDLAFVSRLAEHLGISFVFEHGDEAPERVIFTDDVVNAGLTADQIEIPYRPSGELFGAFAVVVERQMIPTKYMAQDYNYRNPNADISGKAMLGTEAAPLGNGGGVIEYGTHQLDQTEGDAIAAVRKQERESRQEVFSVDSTFAELSAGSLVKLSGFAQTSDPELLIVSIEHNATFGSDDGAGYKNSFRAVPKTVHYRPPRSTPRPRIHGLVTGTVALGTATAPGGAAQIDNEGRYLVQFHLDPDQERVGPASHAIRMAQMFAGPTHGIHFPLRPGSEVVLSFLDGDPDRPIIVGSVPNHVNRSTTTSANSNKNRLHSTAGVLIEFGEGK